MILTIAARELRSLFLSPIAWVTLALLFALMMIIFAVYFRDYSDPANVRLFNDPMLGITHFVVMPFYFIMAVILQIVVPLLTMRSFSDEHRSRTLTLLFSSPISMSEIVIGKFLGVYFFMLIVIMSHTIIPLSILMIGKVEFGQLFTALIGVALITAMYSAIGVYISSLTKQPIIAALGTITLLLILWFLQSIGAKEENEYIRNVLTYLSSLSHFDSFSEGRINSTDVSYYILISLTFIGLCIKRLDNTRLNG
jgi:ABC-2 type transport system permease protein